MAPPVILISLHLEVIIKTTFHYYILIAFHLPGISCPAFDLYLSSSFVNYLLILVDKFLCHNLTFLYPDRIKRKSQIPSPLSFPGATNPAW